MLSLKNLLIKASSSYNVIIKRGIISILLNQINLVCNAKKIAIITDSNVASLHLDNILSCISDAGFSVNTVIIPAGEQSKNISTVEKICVELSKNYISKSDLLISLGGGVVSDICGFVASTYLRGVKCIHIPTTLIAQVDASIGGKTAVNLSTGKNSIGTFYHPASVLIDPEFLSTLPASEISCGMAEVIKYALIKNKDLFDTLYNYSDNILNESFIDNVIFDCVKIKKNFIEHDEFDENERMLLNFGHTIGHAIEKYFNYSKYSHGQAISIGMLEIIKLGETIGITKSSCFNKVLHILQKYDLPTDLNIPLNQLIDFILLDKKNIDDKLNLVLIKDIGDSYVKSFDTKEIKYLLRR